MQKITKEKHLGTLLVEKGVITNEQLQEVLLAQKGSNMRIGQLLIKKGLAPVHFLKKNKIVPFKYEGKTIFVAVLDFLNIQPFDDLKMIYQEYNFEPVIVSNDEIQRLLNSHFDVMKNESTDEVIDNLEESDLEILSSPVSETEDILDMANEAPIIKLVNMAMREAINRRASDIHIEPYEKDLIIRFRIDGILYPMYTPPKKFQGAIISRIKIMANLNIAENRLPQDGRIQLKIGGKDIDIRVSIYPTYYGERVVLRLLNKTDMEFSLNSLGFSDDTLEKFNELIKKTHGIVMVTGPTGSGKSTTLYSVLTRLNQPDVNILTVEDPIEYQLHGIGQMQVKPKIDLTFAAGLRSILRQDPDIIMVGEIRDVETAEIAVQAALTGHRVFSTLHTNDAASGITRLIDMGVEPFLIASSVNAFLAQRLVRSICPHCKTSFRPTPKMLSDLGLSPAKFKNVKLYQGKGCDKCLNTGFMGRMGIYELLPVSTEIRKLVMAHSDAMQIKELAIKEGMVTLYNDGLEKVMKGITTLEEVIRVS